MGFTKILEHFHHFLEIKNIFTRNFEKMQNIFEDQKYLHLKMRFSFQKVAIVCDFELGGQ